jgi:hypothetical protein
MNSIACVRLRGTGARVVRLENRRTLTGLVSSNLTLSAKSKLVGSTTRRCAGLDVAAKLRRSGAKRRTSGVRREQSHPLRQSLGKFLWVWIS